MCTGLHPQTSYCGLAPEPHWGLPSSRPPGWLQPQTKTPDVATDDIKTKHSPRTTIISTYFVFDFLKKFY